MTANTGNDLLRAIASRLRSAGIRDVQVQDEPLSVDQIRPGVYVTPPTEGNGQWEEITGGGTNERDDIGYGCQITIVGGTLAPFDQYSGQVLDIRQLIRKMFHNKRMGLLPEELHDERVSELGCVVRDGDFLLKIDHPHAMKTAISVRVVRCWVRESRQLEAD